MVENQTTMKYMPMRHSKIWISRTIAGLKQNITTGLVVLAAANISEYGLKKEDIKPLIQSVCIAIIDNSPKMNESDMQLVMRVFDLKPEDVRRIFAEYVIKDLKEENYDTALSKLEKFNKAIAYNKILRKAD